MSQYIVPSRRRLAACLCLRSFFSCVISLLVTVVLLSSPCNAEASISSRIASLPSLQQEFYKPHLKIYSPTRKPVRSSPMYAETGSHPSFVTRFLESHRHVSTSTVYRWETDPAKPQSPSSPPTQTTPSHVSVPYPFHPGGVEGPEPLPQHDIGNEELADPSLYQYGCMIDAGSTGSRLYIYRWHPRVRTLHATIGANSPAPRRPFSRPVTQEGWNVKVMPGLSAYAANPERAGLGLQPLIDFAVATFQALNITDRIPKSPIYLKATGGMRALQEDTRDQVMAHVHAFLMNTGFYFKPEFARVISGEEEGVFGWLTVNYLASRRTLFWNETKERSEHTVGALDLGGASMQATFRPLKTQTLLANQYPLFLAYTRNSLYTECFWYYGKDSALWRVHNVLFMSSYPELVDAKARASAFSTGWKLAVASTASRNHRKHVGHPQLLENLPLPTPEIHTPSPSMPPLKLPFKTTVMGAVGAAATTPATTAATTTAVASVTQESVTGASTASSQDNGQVVDASEAGKITSGLTAITASLGKKGAKVVHGIREKQPSHATSPASRSSSGKEGDVVDDPVFRSPCLPRGFEARFEGPGGALAVVEGDADWEQCYELAKHIVETRLTGPCLSNYNSSSSHSMRSALPVAARTNPSTSSQWPGECTSFFGLYKPDFSDRTFYSFSGFSYFVKFAGLSSTASLQEVADAGRHICSMDWNTLLQTYPTANKYYLRSYCWLSIYAVALLHEGFGFPMQNSRLLWTNSILNTDVTYALGAMLYDVNLLPWELGPNVLAQTHADTASNYFWAFVVTFVLLVASLYMQWRANSPKRRPPGEDLGSASGGENARRSGSVNNSNDAGAPLLASYGALSEYR